MATTKRVLARTVTGALGVAIASGAMTTPATAAPAPTKAPATQATALQQAKGRIPDGVILAIAWEREQKSHWCGPAAARMALKSWVRKPATQPHLARDMVTGVFDPATADIRYATYAMNKALQRSGKGKPYASRAINKNASTKARRNLLLHDARITVGLRGRAMVVNVKSTAKRKLVPGYPNRNVYHYVTISGYDLYRNGGSFHISDPASGLNKDYKYVPKQYWVTATRLAEILHAGDGDHYYTTMS